MEESNFYNAVLTGGTLEGSDFTRVNMSNAILNGARLDNALFIETKLKSTHFINAVLSGADFTYAKKVPEHLKAILKKQNIKH